MNTLSIPDHDLAEFATSYSEDCRREVRRYLRSMERLLACRSRGIGELLEQEGAKLGLSGKRLRAIYDDFRKSLDWRDLVNNRKFPSLDGKLPGEFIEKIWWPLCEDNQRKLAPAHRELLRFWETGLFTVKGTTRKLDQVPGYDLWPEEFASKGHPYGWSYKNLTDRYAPKDFDLAAMREGLGFAMAKFGPTLITTRVGLWVGSHYVVDDVLRDFLTLLLPKNVTARIQELGVLDLLSADRFAVHRRPKYEDAATGKKDSVKESEMRFLVAAVLRNQGYSPRGTQFVVEHGTAAIRDHLEAFLFEHSKGLITVRRSGISGREQAVAGYWGRGGGNPRHKAPLESHHNLLHNESGNMLAATGHDRNYPEWLCGIEAMTGEVCEALATLPAGDAELLIAPMAEYWQAVGIMRVIDGRIAWRKDHDLEGWSECGHVIVEYREDARSGEWMSTSEFLSLPEGRRQLIAAAAISDPRYRRPRKLSPREVFAAGSRDLIKFPDHVIALMFCDDRLGIDLRKPKRMRGDGRFYVQHELAGPEEMVFEGRNVTTATGEVVALPEDATWSVALNPFDTGQLWIYGAKGEFMGTASRLKRVCPIDQTGIDHQLGKISHEKSTLMTPLRDRHAGASAEIEAIKVHNARVRAGVPVTAEAMQEARETKKREPDVRRARNDKFSRLAEISRRKQAEQTQREEL